MQKSIKEEVLTSLDSSLKTLQESSQIPITDTTLSKMKGKLLKLLGDYDEEDYHQFIKSVETIVSEILVTSNEYKEEENKQKSNSNKNVPRGMSEQQALDVLNSLHLRLGGTQKLRSSSEIQDDLAKAHIHFLNITCIQKIDRVLAIRKSEQKLRNVFRQQRNEVVNSNLPEEEKKERLREIKEFEEEEIERWHKSMSRFLKK